jgi:hypothetical protein
LPRLEHSRELGVTRIVTDAHLLHRGIVQRTGSAASPLRITHIPLDGVAATWLRGGDRRTRTVGELWVPAEAQTLWGWRNGANLEFIAKSGGHSFGSLQHAIEWVEMMRRIAEEVADSYGPRADKAKIARDVWNWDWFAAPHGPVESRPGR